MRDEQGEEEKSNKKKKGMAMGKETRVTRTCVFYLQM